MNGEKTRNLSNALHAETKKGIFLNGTILFQSLDRNIIAINANTNGTIRVKVMRSQIEEAMKPKPIKTVCNWKYDDNTEAWETDCDGLFCIENGTPADNEMNFCCYCGKKLSVVKEKSK